MMIEIILHGVLSLPTSDLLTTWDIWYSLWETIGTSLLFQSD
jgi:hypothetical protein